MVDQHNFLCDLWSLIKRMLIARALGVPVPNVIFGLFCGMLLCVCMVPEVTQLVKKGIWLWNRLPLPLFSLFYRPPGGHDPTITLPNSEWVRN